MSSSLPDGRLNRLPQALFHPTEIALLLAHHATRPVVKRAGIVPGQNAAKSGHSAPQKTIVNQGI
jgi:hypothetical protein